jgi:DNA invertase Pin-like site-specific DNA recombinase
LRRSADLDVVGAALLGFLLSETVGVSSPLTLDPYSKRTYAVVCCTQREGGKVNVYGYGRISRDKNETGLSLAVQREQVERAAAARGWGPVCWHQDENYSGKNLNRPAISHLLDVLDRDGGVLVVAKLDRLSRSVYHFSGIVERALRHRWALVVLDADVDTSTPAGALFANMLASYADYERRVISHRTKDALAQLKAQGVRLGRPVALPEPVRSRVASERAQGRSLRAIADTLTDEGVPTAQGGARWHASTVASVLRSLDLDAQAA